jgi:pilus assembly protein CpaE
MWDSIGFDRNRLMLVVNRFDKNSPITVKKMSDTMKNPIARTIPADPAAYKAANLGVPLLLNDSKSPMSRAIIDLAAMVTRQASQVPVDDRFHVFLQY